MPIVSGSFFFLLQVFVLGGRFIFGPDVRSLFYTIFLIVAPVAVFCVFVARKLLDDFPHHLGISIMAAVVALTLSVSSFSSLKHHCFSCMLLFVTDILRIECIVYVDFMMWYGY